MFEDQAYIMIDPSPPKALTYVVSDEPIIDKPPTSETEESKQSKNIGLVTPEDQILKQIDYDFGGGFFITEN